VERRSPGLFGDHRRGCRVRPGEIVAGLRDAPVSVDDRTSYRPAALAVLVIGGLALGFAPGVPEIELEPDLVLLIFLPPLLYAAAFFSNLRELRANAQAIGVLAIGLTAVTMVTVAAVAHAVIGLDWKVAFVLGAVVSPTDAVAPATILRRLGVPRRVITVVEGENLTNDWTALVAYKFAVAAVLTGSFSLASAGPRFLLTGVGGVAVGVVAGIAVAALRRRLEDPLTEITISLLTAYAAYLPAEALGFSGVLAAVTVGVWLGWVFGLAALPRQLSRVRTGQPLTALDQVSVVAWAGMRGAVSLAAALAIPLETDAGAPFPARDLIIFLTFATILATLVFQGVTMPALIRGLGIEDDGLDHDEELAARLEIAFAAIDRIESLAGEDWVEQQTVERTRPLFEYRRRRFSSRIDGEDSDDEFDYESRSASYTRFMAEVIGAQRQTLRTLRDDGRISDEVRRRVEYDLDLEQERLTGTG
jgi:CPA1 family monovalent cation:H+ antiporter